MISLEKNKILLIILIIIAFVCLASVYSSTPQEKSDDIIIVDNLEFNTTADSNITQLLLNNYTEHDDGTSYRHYVDENFTGYNIHIWNVSAFNDSEWNDFVTYVKKDLIDDPSETINGITIYNSTAEQGEHVGEPRFDAFIINNNLKTIVEISTPNPNETVKIASSLKFV